MKKYPVIALMGNIMEILAKTDRDAIQKAIQNGMQEKPLLVDESGRITDALSIDSKGQIYVSVAFVQLLWLISRAIVMVYDAQAIKTQKDSLSPEEWERMLKDEIYLYPEVIEYIERYEDYESCLKEVDRQLNIAQRLAMFEEPDENVIGDIGSFSTDDAISKHTNSICCYGIVFGLLHEIAHWNLNHFKAPSSLRQEKEADATAFWKMYLDSTGKEHQSAMFGIIALLASILYVTPTLKDDGIHPIGNERLFEYFDIVKDENYKYSGMLMLMLLAWARLNCDRYPELNDFPQIEENNVDESLKRMREFLDNWAKINNR